MVFKVMEMILVVSLALSFTAIILAYHSFSGMRKQAQANEKLYQRLLRDISIANSGSVGMGQRLLEMEKRLQSDEQNRQHIDYSNDEEFQSYSEAAQLFKMGLSSEEVASRCGLSRTEASLMEMMQKVSR